MKITSIHYSKKFNLGNYENHEIGLTAELDENDDPGNVLTGLITQVNDRHNQLVAEQQAREEAERTERQKIFEERRKAAMAQMQANAREEDDDDGEEF
jgi:hypothetical protein